MNHRSPATRTLAATALLALATSACGLTVGDSEEATTESAAVSEEIPTRDELPVQPSDETPTDPVDTAPDIDDAPAPQDAAEESDEVQSAPSQAPSEPLAQVEGSPPFTELEILDLRRDGDAVTVEFAITVDDGVGSAATADVFAAGPDLFGPLATEGEAGVADARRNAVSGVTLIDRVNGKRHLVLRDGNGHCLCTRFDGRASGGERYIHSAQLPAPPSDVTEVTVEVPMFPSIDNLPLREVS